MDRRRALLVGIALLFVADNGSNWFVSGQHDPRWNDAALDDLKTVPGSAFDVVDTGPVIH